MLMKTSGHRENACEDEEKKWGDASTMSQIASKPPEVERDTEQNLPHSSQQGPILTTP